MISNLFILFTGYFVVYNVHGQRVVINDGLGTVRRVGPRSISISSGSGITESYSFSVNVRCRHDSVNGLVCSADYPDHCKEQWNFPNPCTQYNLDINVTKFKHPFDSSKFLMCGQLGKLYIVQCPQYERFNERCGQCVSQGAGISDSCMELPLPPLHNNPCTQEAILKNKLFFPYHGNLSRFIHCDIWGKPWERICTPGEVWSVWDNTCVLPHLLNPCNRPTTDINYFYGHPCDPAKYLACDQQGRALEVNCARGEAFQESSQRCLPYRDFKDRILSSYCEHFVFGFRQYNSADGTIIRGTDGTMMRRFDGAFSGTSGQGFQTDNAGLSIDRTNRRVDGSLTVTRDTSGQGMNVNLDLSGGSMNRETNIFGQGDGTAAFDRTTKVRGGSIDGQVRTDGQGNFGGTLDVTRGSMNVDRGGSIGQGSSMNLVDVRDKSLKSEFVDVRNAGTSGNSANLIDIRGVKGSGSQGFVDARGADSGFGVGVDGSATMIDVRKVDSGGSGLTDIRNIDTAPGGNAMNDIRTGQVSGSRKFLDVRTVDSGSGSMRDIRNNDPGFGSNGAVDIRGGHISGSSKTVDIRTVDSARGGMNDIRNVDTGFGGTGAVDIRGGQISGSSNTVDIRTQDSASSGMRDIRNIDTGFGGSGAVDIRGGQISGSSKTVDIRTVDSGTIGMSDIRNVDQGFGSSGSGGQISGSSKTVDIRTVDSGTVGMNDIRNVDPGFGNSGTVDIRGGQFSGSSNTVDIRTVDSGTVGMNDIRNVDPGFGSSGAEDIRGGQFSGSSNTVDIRTVDSGTVGMNDIRNVDTGIGGNGAVDFSGGQISGSSKTVDIRTVDSASGGMRDIRNVDPGFEGNRAVDIRGGQISGSSNTVDIRTVDSGTVGMNDIRNVDTGFGGNGAVDIRGEQHTGTRGFADIRTTGTQSSGRAFEDIRVGKSARSGTTVDIQTGSSGVGLDGIGSESIPMSDIRQTGTGQSGQSSGFLDIRTTRTETTGNIVGGSTIGNLDPFRENVGGDVTLTQTHRSDGSIVDLRNVGSGSTGSIDMVGGKDSLSSNLVDVRNTVGDGGFVDISRSRTTMDGRTVDISGNDIGTIQGGKVSGSESVVGISGVSGVDRMVDIQGTRRDITGGMIGTSQTSNSQLSDIIRNEQSRGAITNGNQRGLGSITSFDLRNQLGLNGQLGAENIDSTGTFRKETIRIEGTMQGDRRRGGTMNELLDTWNQLVETGSSSNRQDKLTQTSMNQFGNGNQAGTSVGVHPSRLRSYEHSYIPFTEPCTQKNIDEGRTHFRYRGHPHQFLQCDASGRMYIMNCTRYDYFDPITNTCVDGPVHVDNRVQ